MTTWYLKREIHRTVITLNGGSEIVWGGTGKGLRHRVMLRAGGPGVPLGPGVGDVGTWPGRLEQGLQSAPGRRGENSVKNLNHLVPSSGNPTGLGLLPRR